MPPLVVAFILGRRRLLGPRNIFHAVFCPSGESATALVAFDILGRLARQPLKAVAHRVVAVQADRIFGVMRHRQRLLFNRGL